MDSLVTNFTISFHPSPNSSVQISLIFTLYLSFPVFSLISENTSPIKICNIYFICKIWDLPKSPYSILSGYLVSMPSYMHASPLSILILVILKKFKFSLILLDLENLSEMIHQLIISLMQFTHFVTDSMKLSIVIGEQIDATSRCKASEMNDVHIIM